MSLFDADGLINTTAVDGTTYTGLYAADGSYNVVVDDPTNFGIYHPCGALRVNSAEGETTHDGSGAIYSNRLGGLGANVVYGTNAKIVFFGDSITAARGFAGFADWALGKAGGRYGLPRVSSNGLGPTGWNQGVSGNTTAQMVTRIDNVTAENPKVVVVLGGTNDIGSTADTAATIQGRLRSIYDTIIAAGAKVVAVTILPRTAFDAGQNTRRDAVNTWIKSQTDLGAIVDADLLITNTATQLSDGTHPNGLGAQLLGYSTGGVGDAIASLISSNVLLYTDPAPAANLITNPFFTGGATVATNWSFFQNTNNLTKAASKSSDGSYATQRYVASGTANSANADNFNTSVTVPGLTGTIVEGFVELIVTKDTGLGSIGMGMGVNTAAGTMFGVTAVDSTTKTVPYRVVLRTPQFASTSDNQIYSVRLSMVPTNGAVHDVDIAFSRAGYRVVS